MVGRDKQQQQQQQQQQQLEMMERDKDRDRDRDRDTSCTELRDALFRQPSASLLQTATVSASTHDDSAGDREKVHSREGQPQRPGSAPVDLGRVDLSKERGLRDAFIYLGELVAAPHNIDMQYSY